jgi:aminoglycoside phosphotransferase (APT) family kinase protein
MNQPQGINADHVTEWFRAHVPTVRPPLSFTLLAGGHSNLTFRVDDTAGGSWALRRPPLGHVLPSAHDMAREHRIIDALGPTPVPVPHTAGLCQDDAVNGASFYVMDFVKGLVVRDRAAADALTVAQRAQASQSTIDVLADIHAVDVDAVGLGDLARKEGYIARQLKRWRQQFEASKTRDIPSIGRVHDILAANIPPQGPAGIVHGDYRLDNCIIGDDGNVCAVLDWELCTLGDVLADLGQLFVYWGSPGDDGHALDSPPTIAPGFLTVDQLAERYAKRSGRDLTDLAFYVAFATWKVACILEGVYARYVGGAMGDKLPEHGIESFVGRVDLLAARADHAASRL